MMKKTYTYTARNADEPAQVVTFTLYDHSMSVELGAPLEHIERALQSVSEEIEEEKEARVYAWLKPVVVSLLERGTRPFDIVDVDASVKDGGLRITAWGRSGGLRVAPVTFAMERVDNPAAAQAFVEELNRRKASAARPGKFSGPLDYWVTWFLTGFLAAALLVGWLRKRDKETA